MEVTRNDIQVMYITADDGPAGAKEAFAKLESYLSSLKGRKFYGTYHAGEHRACVALRPGDNPSAIGINTWFMPGGRYIRKKIKDWTQRIPEVEQTLYLVFLANIKGFE